MGKKKKIYRDVKDAVASLVVTEGRVLINPKPNHYESIQLTQSELGYLKGFISNYSTTDSTSLSTAIQIANNEYMQASMAGRERNFSIISLLGNDIYAGDLVYGISKNNEIVSGIVIGKHRLYAEEDSLSVYCAVRPLNYTEVEIERMRNLQMQYQETLAGYKKAKENLMLHGNRQIAGMVYQDGEKYYLYLGKLLISPLKNKERKSLNTFNFNNKYSGVSTYYAQLEGEIINKLKLQLLKPVDVLLAMRDILNYTTSEKKEVYVRELDVIATYHEITGFSKLLENPNFTLQAKLINADNDLRGINAIIKLSDTDPKKPDYRIKILEE